MRRPVEPSSRGATRHDLDLALLGALSLLRALRSRRQAETTSGVAPDSTLLAILGVASLLGLAEERLLSDDSDQEPDSRRKGPRPDGRWLR